MQKKIAIRNILMGLLLSILLLAVQPVWTVAFRL